MRFYEFLLDNAMSLRINIPQDFIRFYKILLSSIR